MVRALVDFNRGGGGTINLGASGDSHTVEESLAGALTQAGLTVQEGLVFVGYELHADRDERGFLDLEVEVTLRYDPGRGWYGQYEPDDARCVPTAQP